MIGEVSTKMLGYHLAQGVDLGVERNDQPDLAGDDGRERLLHGWRLAQRGCSEDGLDLERLDLHITTVRLAQRLLILAADSRAARSGSGAAASTASASGASRSSKASNAAWKYSRSALRRRRTCLHGLVAACDQLHRLAIVGVAGDRAVMAAVQPHDLSEHVRIAWAALGSRG